MQCIAATLVGPGGHLSATRRSRCYRTAIRSATPWRTFVRHPWRTGAGGG